MNEEMRKWKEIFIDKHLPDASVYLKAGLRKELDKLGFLEIFILDSNLSVFMRICRVFEISESIKEVKESKFYDTSEHLMNQVDLELIDFEIDED